ncbi:hypothetical protein [Undibacterium sp. KW1]|uniref:hypothetical protein n=1 Tax=Undibacterium sp. KW1 TaxID=2058624 RepID=UPI0013896A21|nr:hypothetical protein [Undibacterium sp. KW1]
MHLLLPRSPAAGKASASHCHLFFSGINSQPQWRAKAAQHEQYSINDEVSPGITRYHPRASPLQYHPYSITQKLH